MLIFLAPLEKLRQTAQVDFIYTPAFRQAVERRFRLEHSEAELAEMLKGAARGEPRRLVCQAARHRAGTAVGTGQNAWPDRRVEAAGAAIKPVD